MIRSPRLQVLVDGTPLDGVVAADVFATSLMSADRFRVQLAGVADAASLGRSGLRFEVLAVLDEQSVDGGGWTSLVMGQADSVAWDASGRVLDIEGRDLSAVLMETQAGATFANQTASDPVPRTEVDMAEQWWKTADGPIDMSLLPLNRCQPWQFIIRFARAARI